MSTLLETELLSNGVTCNKFVYIRSEFDFIKALKTGFFFFRSSGTPAKISFKYEKLFNFFLINVAKLVMLLIHVMI